VELRAGKVGAPLEPAAPRPVLAAAKLERRVGLRAGKVGARLELAMARPGLAAVKLERRAAPPALAVHLEPRALKAKWSGDRRWNRIPSGPTIAAHGGGEGESGTRRRH
jgi:hypothetical protein